MAENKTNNSRSLRERILLAAKAESVELIFFGQPIQLTQPSMRKVLEYQNLEDRAQAAAQMIVEYAFDPDTGKPVFEITDVESILELPFGEDMTNINEAIAKLTGVDVDGEAKNFDKTLSDST